MYRKGAASLQPEAENTRPGQIIGGPEVPGVRLKFNSNSLTSRPAYDLDMGQGPKYRCRRKGIDCTHSVPADALGLRYCLDDWTLTFSFFADVLNIVGTDRSLQEIL